MAQIKIDLVTEDPASDEYVLYLVEDGPWPTVDAEWVRRLAAIEARVLSAADLAVEGHLASRYPESSAKAIRIQVDSPNGCPRRLETLVKELGEFIDREPAFVEGLRGSVHVSRLRIVTGKQMGRFA